MKKIGFLSILLLSTTLFGQKESKPKIIDFSPAFRLGLHVPVLFGNNVFAKDFNSNLGFHSTLSLVKIYNFRIGLGYEFQRLNLSNPNAIGNFGFINSNTYLYLLEYEIPVGSKFEINPTISYGQTVFNYKNSPGMGDLAKQSLEEIRIGGFVNYALNKTFSGYAGFHFSRFYNADLNASPENKDYFGSGNKFILSLGILIR